MKKLPDRGGQVPPCPPADAHALYCAVVYSSVGAVLCKLMDLCVCYDLVVLKYLSKPNNVVNTLLIEIIINRSHYAPMHDYHYCF